MPHDRESARNARSTKAAAKAAAGRAAKLRKFQWSVLALAAVGLLGFGLLRSSQSGVLVRGDVELGAEAPRVEMASFDGGTVNLAQFEGKPLVMNFWASWCPQCVAEMPDFERVFQDLKGDVQFLGVNQSDNRSSAEDLALETGVTYPLAADPNGEVFTAFRGAGMPTTVFIDGDGRVVDVVTGQLSAEQLREYIERSFPSV